MNPARAVSLVLAAAAIAVLLIDRRALDDGLAWVVRTGLALTTAGIVGGAAHGLAFPAQNGLLRFVAAPRVAWPAIVLGLLCLLFGENLLP